MRLALIGPRGAGKSSLAPMLAAALGLRVVDLDQRLEAEFSEPLRELIAREGFVFFRRAELQALEAALNEGPAVIACGAGIVETEAARASLASRCQTLWLDIDPATQATRLMGDRSRPRLLPGSSINEELELIDRRRRTLYQGIGGPRIDAASTLPMVLQACLKELA